MFFFYPVFCFLALFFNFLSFSHWLCFFFCFFFLFLRFAFPHRQLLFCFFCSFSVSFYFQSPGVFYADGLLWLLLMLPRGWLKSGLSVCPPHNPRRHLGVRCWPRGVRDFLLWGGGWRGPGWVRGDGGLCGNLPPVEGGFVGSCCVVLLGGWVCGGTGFGGLFCE